MLTSELLRKLAPGTRANLRDRFLPYLNEAMPRYGIDTELRAAAFLATVCFESMSFRKTAEVRIVNPKNPVQASIKRMQDKYWHLGYYGRGLIQLTHEDNYEAFFKYLANDAHFQGRVVEKEDLEQPEWAVESACWYWKEHNLNQLADKGKFRQIQKAVNRGNPDSKRDAIDYPDRLKLYDIALDALPDNFHFDGAEPSPNPSATAVTLQTDSDNTSTSAPSFLDRVTNPIQNAKAKFDRLGVDPSTISKSSAVTSLSTKILGWLTLGMAFLTSNWIYVVAALFLIGLAVVVFVLAKRNATTRVVALKS